MEFDLYFSNLGKTERIILQRKSALGIAQTIVPMHTAKSWKSWLFSGFTSAKERLKGFV
jgi:hypothetical protein